MPSPSIYVCILIHHGSSLRKTPQKTTSSSLDSSPCKKGVVQLKGKSALKNGFVLERCEAATNEDTPNFMVAWACYAEKVLAKVGKQARGLERKLKKWRKEHGHAFLGAMTTHQKGSLRMA